MDRKGIWLLATAVVLAATIFGLSQAIAQRDFRTEPRPRDGGPARYQVVNVTEAEIILLDVTTGDLYSAKPKDVKPYDARPRPGMDRPPPAIDKEEFRKDKEKDLDKREFKKDTDKGNLDKFDKKEPR
jgi:hypothetical protein